MKIFNVLWWWKVGHLDLRSFLAISIWIDHRDGTHRGTHKIGLAWFWGLIRKTVKNKKKKHKVSRIKQFDPKSHILIFKKITTYCYFLILKKRLKHYLTNWVSSLTHFSSNKNIIQFKSITKASEHSHFFFLWYKLLL